MLVRAVEHSTTGITLLEVHGQVVYSNQAAREILTQDDGLFIEAGQIRAPRKSDDDALQRLLRGAVGPPHDHAPPLGGIMAVPRRSGKAPYTIVAVPVRLERSALRSDEAVVTVFISDPTALRELSDAHIRNLYRLTPKEAKLAVLLTGGATVAKAATALGMAEKTARIHLQGLFRKTGTRRQVDLVRVLLGSAGATRTPSGGDSQGTA
jgi:DNA-binding CsgD family transcriptional regulator